MTSAKPAPIDLRSDTVTRPTDEMRRAMFEAELGDDVWGDDPTVNRLQELAAKRLGKEAALFFPSGTMVNNAAIWAHTGRRGGMVAHEDSHVVWYEGGGASLLSNVFVRTVPGAYGVFGPAAVEPLLSPVDPHFVDIRLVEIENTHVRQGGTCWTAAQTRTLAKFAHEHNVPVHLDGARIFNSAIAQDVPVEALAHDADSVGFCLSKGLSAPVGSVLCGSHAFINEAKNARKTLGGGMRQAGVIAAAGIVALETMVSRLAEDHANARRLAAALARLPGLDIDLGSVQTNIVMIRIDRSGWSPEALCDALAKEGILAAPRDVGPFVRLVTHRHITTADVDLAVASFERVLRRTPKRKVVA